MATALIKEEERHILSVLPLLLKKDYIFRGKVYGILTETFATKEDLNQMLVEMRISREESNKRFEQMDKRFEQAREESNKRFEQAREESNKRFEQMDKRFEQMQQQMDKRFEQMNKQFEQVDRKLEAIDKELKDQKDWVGIIVGGFQRRAGKSLEDAIAGTLRVALRKIDVKPENIKLRTKITDDNGVIGPKDRTYEVDIYLHNSESMIFEVKSYLEEEDIFRFNDKAELAKEKLRLHNPLKVIVSLEKGRETSRLCEEMGIILA